MLALCWHSTPAYYAGIFDASLLPSLKQDVTPVADPRVAQGVHAPSPHLYKIKVL